MLFNSHYYKLPDGKYGRCLIVGKVVAFYPIKFKNNIKYLEFIYTELEEKHRFLYDKYCNVSRFTNTYWIKNTQSSKEEIKNYLHNINFHDKFLKKIEE